MNARLFLAVFICFSVWGQRPSAVEYWTGKIIGIAGTPNYFEYTILAGCGYVGRSVKPIHVREDAEVKFAIKGESIYVIDDNGKARQLRYVLQFMPPRVPPPPSK